MHWPNHRVRVGTRQRPKWISPSTASLIVIVNGDPRYTTIANAPKRGSVSNIRIAAPPGPDSFNIVLYDARQKPGESYPQGSAVGQAIVSKTIAEGKKNAVKATIEGIPSVVDAAPARNQPFVRANGSGGYYLIGNAPSEFVLTAKDADANVIVPQPAVRLRVRGRNAAYYTVSDDPSNAQGFFVRPIAPEAGRTAQLNLTAQDDNGDRADSLLPVAQLSAFYVLYADAPGGGPGVAAYDSTGKLLSLPSGSFSGLSDPRALAYDSDRSRVYVADHGYRGGAVRGFDALGNPLGGAWPLMLPGAIGLAYDAGNGLLYASSYSVNILGQATNGAAALEANGGASSLAGSSLNTAGGAVAILPSEQYSFPYVAITNTKKTHASDPLVRLYTEDFGTAIETSTAGIQTDFTGVIDAAGVVTIDQPEIVACGTPASGGADVEMQDRFGTVISSINVPGCQGVAFDPNSSETYVTSATSNQIVAIKMSFGSETLASVDPERTISTPPSSGFSNPLRLAIVY